MLHAVSLLFRAWCFFTIAHHPLWKPQIRPAFEYCSHTWGGGIVYSTFASRLDSTKNHLPDRRSFINTYFAVIASSSGGCSAIPFLPLLPSFLFFRTYICDFSLFSHTGRWSPFSGFCCSASCSFRLVFSFLKTQIMEQYHILYSQSLINTHISKTGSINWFKRAYCSHFLHSAHREIAP